MGGALCEGLFVGDVGLFGRRERARLGSMVFESWVEGVCRRAASGGENGTL